MTEDQRYPKPGPDGPTAPQTTRGETDDPSQRDANGRFKKNCRSPNPRGRPRKKNLDLRSALFGQLNRPLAYMTKDGPRKAPAVELIARNLVAESARGSPRSLKALTDILSKKPGDFVDPKISNHAEMEKAAASFDAKIARALAAVEREREELEKSRPDEADVKKAGSEEE